MLKKIYFSITLAFISLTALPMSLNTLNDQLVHLYAQIKVVKVSWQRAERTLRNAQKLNPILYHQTQSDAKDLLASRDIITKMDELANQQANTITNNKNPYKAVNFLDEYFPEKLTGLHTYLRLVCSAMANREFRLLLGRRLVNKKNGLMVMIEAAKNIEPPLAD